MVAATYAAAMVRVFADEGGYSDDKGDPGGPTNHGITIHDARLYWKPTATADDVKAMPESVASDIYNKHYALPIRYNDLPAGFDYTVFDAGINSGVGRAIIWAAACLNSTAININSVVNLASSSIDKVALIQAFWKKRLSFLRALSTFSRFGKGWTRRCTTGEAAAVKMWLTLGAKLADTDVKTKMTAEAAKATAKAKTSSSAATGGVVGGGGATVYHPGFDLMHLSTSGKIAAVVFAAGIIGLVVYFVRQTIVHNQRAAAYTAAA